MSAKTQKGGTAIIDASTAGQWRVTTAHRELNLNNTTPNQLNKGNLMCCSKYNSFVFEPKSHGNKSLPTKRQPKQTTSQHSTQNQINSPTKTQSTVFFIIFVSGKIPGKEIPTEPGS